MTEISIKQIGGSRIGRSYSFAWSVTFPLVTLWADKEKITLRGLVVTRVFPKETIVRLSRFRSSFSTGLRIEHTESKYDPFVLFWTFNYRKLKRVLQELEYPIVDNKRNIKD